jgi:2-polyprenyl-3-methyl-5-hydroxy-6-metoxy-1,4-benzoquinol methylase
MSKTEKRFFRCSICDAVDFTFVGYSGFYASRTTARICRNCGLVCLNPRWDEAGYAEYYRGAYYGTYLTLDNSTNPSDVRGLSISKVTAQFADPSASILEIGAGFGGNMRALHSNGYSNLTGIEVDSHCCQSIKDNIPTCRLFNGTLNDYTSATREKYDVIILSHVLEHFVEPNDALLQVRSLLKPDGKLLILVPDTGYPHRLLAQLTTPHTHYFTKRTLDLILRKCGFENLFTYDHLPGDIFILCRSVALNMVQPPLETSEYFEQLQRLRIEWLTAWPRQLGRRLCEFMLSERQARSLWLKFQDTRKRLFSHQLP